MVKFFIVLFLALSLSAPVYATSAKVYVWRDENGVLVFSDSPKPGAEEVTLKPESAVIPSMNVETSLLDIKPKALENDFQVVINQPQNNATIRDNTGSVYVSGGIQPVFARGHTIQLYLDGKPYGEPQENSIYSLRDIDRGEHQIKMELRDTEGKVIATSKITTFYMHRASKR